MWRRSSTAVLLAALTCTAPKPVSAAAPLPPPETTERPEPLLSRALQLFEDKRFDEAIELFQEAYALDPEANYLFNIGRVYEEKGDLETAVTYYQRFVDHPDAAPGARGMARKRIQELQAELPPPELVVETVPPPTVETPSPAPPQSGEAANFLPATSAPVPTTITTTSTSRLKLRIAGYSLFGGGAALLAVAAGFAGSALSQQKRLDTLSTLEPRDAAIQRGERNALIADSLFIAGGIVAVTGLTLTLVSLRRRPRGHSP